MGCRNLILRNWKNWLSCSWGAMFQWLKPTATFIRNEKRTWSERTQNCHGGLSGTQEHSLHPSSPWLSIQLQCLKGPATAAPALELRKYLDQDSMMLKEGIQQEPEEQWAAVLTHQVSWPRSNKEQELTGACLPMNWVPFPYAFQIYEFLLGTVTTQEKTGKHSFAWTAWHSPYPHWLRKPREKIQITNINTVRGDMEIL